MIARPATGDTAVIGKTIGIVGAGMLPENYGPYYQFVCDSASEVWDVFRSVPILRAYEIAVENGAQYIHIIPIPENTYESLVENEAAISTSIADIIVPVGFPVDLRITSFISTLCEIKTYMGEPSFAIQSFVYPYELIGGTTLFADLEDPFKSSIFNCITYTPSVGHINSVDMYHIDHYGVDNMITGLGAVALAAVMTSLDIDESVSNKEVRGVVPNMIVDKSAIDYFNRAGVVGIYRDGFDTYRFTTVTSYRNKYENVMSDEYKTPYYAEYIDMMSIRVLHYCGKLPSRNLGSAIGYPAGTVNIRSMVDSIMRYIIEQGYITDYSFDVSYTGESLSVTTAIVSLTVHVKTEIKALTMQFQRRVG